MKRMVQLGKLVLNVVVHFCTATSKLGGKGTRGIKGEVGHLCRIGNRDNSPPPPALGSYSLSK